MSHELQIAKIAADVNAKSAGEQSVDKKPRQPEGKVGKQRY